MAVLKRYILLCLLALWPLIGVQANSLQLQEQEIKIGLLYNFLKYTEWPVSSFGNSSHIVVCVFGGDPFSGNLNPMAGRTVNQREIIVRAVHNAEDVEGCHMLFVNAGQKTLWPRLKQSLAGKNVLTVSDFSAFAASGGMIEFGRKDSHVSVSLNMEAVTAARLRVQDRLLKLVNVMQEGR